MLEVYVALTLLGIGVLLNKNTPKKIPVKKGIAPVRQIPSMQNVYNSTMIDTVRQQEANQVKKHNDKLVSQLAGMEVDKVHGNMFPFLRGSVRQNVSENANVNIMENFGTKNDVMFRKQEIAGMFVPEPNIKPTTLVDIDDLTTRVPKPFSQKNVLPFKQERVGRGIDNGYGTQPTGGFQQTNIIEKIMPKNVDELRIASNPKLGATEGRVNPGLKGTSKRTDVGKVEKRRPDTAFEMSFDRLLKTTGFLKKDKMKEVILPKDTARSVTSAYPYSGGAYDARKGHERRGQVKEPSKQMLDTFQVANIKGKIDTNDYGKASVQIYDNGRNITTTNTYKGNVQSLIKSIITPVQDIIKSTRKESFLNPTREFGELNVQIPSKLTVYDSNDVARTTIKETTIHDREGLNLKGPVKLKVHDSNEVARTTIKETTIHDREGFNLKGPVKLTVYDPADIARTTSRQTILQQSEAMNVSSHTYKTNVYDPNNVARTTVKETLLQDTEFANMRKIKEKGVVYQPGDSSRSTIRQTLDFTDTNTNLSSVLHKGTSYDPNDVTRVTIKETTLNEDRIGVVSGFTNLQNSAYVESKENMFVKGTQQQSYNDNDYYGSAQVGLGGNGYEDANYEAKTTMKEDPYEYFGVAADQTTTASRLQDDAYAQTYRGNKNPVERDPTNEGMKSNLNLSSMGDLDIKKTILQTNNQALPVAVNVNTPHEINFTKTRQFTDDIDRMDLEILEPFKKNPFTQSLNSFA